MTDLTVVLLGMCPAEKGCSLVVWEHFDQHNTGNCTVVSVGCHWYVVCSYTGTHSMFCATCPLGLRSVHFKCACYVGLNHTTFQRACCWISSSGCPFLLRPKNLNTKNHGQPPRSPHHGGLRRRSRATRSIPSEMRRIMTPPCHW